MSSAEADSFDILLWWSLNSPCLPIMSEIAKYVSAIPLSSVAFECAFSKSGRVLSQFKSSLSWNMVEALICAQDWLKSSSVDKFLSNEKDVPEIELEKEYDNVVVEPGIGGRVGECINIVPGDQTRMGLDTYIAHASHS